MPTDLTASSATMTRNRDFVRVVSRCETVKGNALRQYARLIDGVQEELLNANWSEGIDGGFAFLGVIILGCREPGADASAVNGRIGRSSIRQTAPTKNGQSVSRRGYTRQSILTRTRGQESSATSDA